MTQTKTSNVLSDAEILSLADAHLRRGINERGGPMALRAHLCDAERAMAGNGVVRRDLPLLRGRIQEEVEPSFPVPSMMSYARLCFAPKMGNKTVDLSKIAAELAGVTMENTDEFIEVHYGSGASTTVVVIRGDRVVLTRSLTGSLPPPL